MKQSVKNSFWLKGGLVLLTGLFLFQPEVQAKVILPQVFSSNMVLQQKDKVQFYGTASAGKKLTVAPSWDKKKYTTQVSNDGSWQVTVPTPAAGKGFTITFNDGEELSLNNVLVGEVWVASGQSNMEMWMANLYGNVVNAEQEIAAANYPEIRLVTVEQAVSKVPLKDVKVRNGGWLVCSPKTVSNFSAVGYFFARDLYKKLNVPIGIISSSVGGTIAEAWTGADALKTMPDFNDKLATMQQQVEKNITDKMQQAAYQQELNNYLKLIDDNDAGYSQGKPVWADAGVSTETWASIDIPGVWEEQGLPGFDGMVWVRRKVTVPATWAGKDLTISVGPVDDDETTFFNGQIVGGTFGWGKPRIYKIPASLVKAGENILTVRVGDNGGDGGIYGKPEEMFLANAAGEKLPLEGQWHYKPGVNYASLPPRPQSPTGANRVTVLYNAMVHPLIKIPVKGAIWYQGEGNASRAYQYRTLFPLMINNWRKSWNRPELPFYFVQLANFKEPAKEPSESDWAELREAQAIALQLPNTGMAVTIDVGEEKDIHPKNKQDVGYRLALAALAQTYGLDIPYSGPMYQRMSVEGNSIRLSFKHAEGGLITKDGKAPSGFAIAGPDKEFYWADTRIEGNEIIVSSPEVPNPVAARYAWANNPQANLYNGANLPASPFRTDDWPGITANAK